MFFTSGAVGGAERVTLTIAKMLPRDEYEAKVVHVCKQVNNLDQFVPKCMESTHLRIKNIWDFTTLRLCRLIREEKPYAVFSSLHYLNVRVIFAAKLAGVKKIIVRNNIGLAKWNPLTMRLARLTYRYASSIISQSEEMRKEFQEAFPDLKGKMLAIPNPLDFDTINSKIENSSSPYPPTKTKNYVYVGRIDAVKGLDVLLMAFANVVKSENDSFLTIVGNYSQNPGYFETLKQLGEKLKIADKIKFIGFSDNPYKYIKFADCFVLPSRSEGNPNVLHEAMFLETPVVATRSIPMIQKVVTPERGFTVDVDDVAALAEAMLRAANMKISIPYSYSGGEKEFLELFE